MQRPVAQRLRLAEFLLRQSRVALVSGVDLEGILANLAFAAAGRVGLPFDTAMLTCGTCWMGIYLRLSTGGRGSEYDKISHGAGRADSGLRGGIDLDAIRLCVRSESVSEKAFGKAKKG